jgi:cytochrome c-type biogenesis protein CcmH
MIVWIAFTLMVVVAAVGITIPLVRRYDARRAAPAENAVLARQLAEIDGQAAGEAQPADVAEGLKTDLIRRFLADAPAGESAARPISGRSLVVLAIGLGAVIAIGATVLYTQIGRPDLAGVRAGAAPDQASAAGAGAAAGAPDGHVAGMIAQLEAKMRQSPNDPEGWRMLGWSYGQTGRYADSAAAYARAAALDPANADYPSAEGESLVKAADGQVTPQAQAAFAAAYQRDPTDPRARYFLAAAKDQAGDHAGALNDWIALLKSAPPGAPWAAEVRGFVQRIAASRGEDVTARLPPLPPPAPAQAAATDAAALGAPPGGGGAPSPDQAAAIQQMAPTDQQAMIHAMVDRLAARLKASPADPNGWVGLMRARMVLGDPSGAAAALHDAVKANPAQAPMLTQTARQLQVPGA